MKQRRCKGRVCRKPLVRRPTEGQHRWASREYCSDPCRLDVQKPRLAAQIEAGQ